LLPIAEHTRAVAMIEAEQAAVFDAKRVAGEREPSEAYAADGLCRVLDRAGRKAAGDTTSPTTAVDDTVVDDWSFAKVIVNVDLLALERGHTLPGERCEIPGQGPVPVADVFRMIDGDAFVAAVSSRGTEISQVVHLGRRPTALQRTALEHRNGAVCSIEGCNSSARLEIDHVTEWAATKRTELSELAFVCGHHHDLKTHHRHRFGPLQPNGKRRLIPPDQARAPDKATGPPDTTGPPELTLHQGLPDDRPPPGAEAPGPDTGPIDTAIPTIPTPPTSEPNRATPTTPSSVEARARAIARRARSQGALFDTG
jgi:hypothetical protein